MVNSKIIKTRIKNIGITQNDLARKIGISSQLLSMKILNRRTIYLEDAEKISSVLGIADEDFGEIFFGGVVAQRNGNSR